MFEGTNGLTCAQINKQQFDILHKPKLCGLCSSPSVGTHWRGQGVVNKWLGRESQGFHTVFVVKCNGKYPTGGPTG